MHTPCRLCPYIFQFIHIVLGISFILTAKINLLITISLQGNYSKALPPVILGILSFLGALSCLLLPETLNKSTPVTLEDGEKFGLGESIFSFSCFNSEPEVKVTTISIIALSDNE